MLARRSNPPPALAADGALELPPGKIAAVATYLELKRLPAISIGSIPGAFERIAGDLARYRRLYAEVGQPWLWFSRAVLDDGSLARIIDDPDVDALAFVMGGQDAGIVELDFRARGECELAFFGLTPPHVGRRLGLPVLAAALRRAFARPIRRVWLHTCTLDHPAAMCLYLRAGFRPYRRTIEVADDPRLTGHLSDNAAPFFPPL